MGLSGHGIPSEIVPFVPVVCGASYHLLGYRILQDSKIRFRLQVESYIGDWLFSKSRLLASYVSHHKAMAYDTATKVEGDVRVTGQWLTALGDDGWWQQIFLFFSEC